MSRALTALQAAPAASRSFYVGRDSSGNWVAQDGERRCCAVFAGRAQALRFALFDDGLRPRAAIMVPGVLELDMCGARASHEVRHRELMNQRREPSD